MYTTIEKCRICKSSNLITIFDLGEQTLTGVFPKSKEMEITKGPIQLVKCTGENSCGLVQLKQSYNLSEMYGLNYGYRSSLNISMVKHLQDKVDKIVSMNLLNEGDLVLDIGSNDATTLRSYPSGHYKLIGIDPTGVKFSKFYPPDIDLISDFFTENVFKRNYGEQKAKIITSFSMFYDLEDPISFSKDVVKILHKDGVWILEQSYLPSMLRANSFDTICHEHLEFYSLKQIKWIADYVGLKIKDVELNEINGGSFSVELVHKDSCTKINNEKIEAILDQEIKLGLDDDGKAFTDFIERVEIEKHKLIEFLKHQKANNKKVVGLGASTKGNVLLQYYNLNSDLVKCIGEINSDKFGCYTPQTLIPLIDEKILLSESPDYILILPWHFKDFFINLDRLKGYKLVFPLPNFNIIQC